ncbi:hypothetical protein Glove_519g10 [Diversispora epigaea]|uniref:Uncharacterized protein n=1 Tax=Diversispora epigaea TaxID=1348612 RepID=A0A397GIK2_9GLOM|nr:hypothetical protein Glove_519g10 [Diversispora epigaea]
MFKLLGRLRRLYRTGMKIASGRSVPQMEQVSFDAVHDEIVNAVPKEINKFPKLGTNKQKMEWASNIKVFWGTTRKIIKTETLRERVKEIYINVRSSWPPTKNV